MISTAQRLDFIEEYYFSKKLKEISLLNTSGEQVINLGIGSPDLPPHEKVVQVLKESSEDSKSHGYQSYHGLLELRLAISKWYKKYFNVELNPDTEILPLIGSKEGIMHISMTYLQKGDEVLIPNPGYPAYKACTELSGASCKFYDLIEEENWEPPLEALEKTDLSKVKIMWVNYPHMPTGAKGSNALFRKLKAFGEKHKILICNDNPYSFILNTAPSSLFSAGYSDYFLELNSLSKSHNMAGWRVGMILANKTHIKNILTFKSNMDSGMFKPIQLAASTALGLDSAWYEELNSLYQKRKVIAIDILRELSCQMDPDQVGLFVWGKVPESILSVKEWIDRILVETRVFMVPGETFGSQGKRYIRISLCADEALLKNALERIRKWKINK